MERLNADLLLSLGLWVVVVYFSAATLRGLFAWVRFLRLRGGALVTWPAAPRPASRAFGTGLGCLAAGLVILGLAQHASPHLIASQALMAFYFLGVTTVLGRVRPGLYAGGIWADGAYARYDEIARWAFSDSAEIRLLIVLRGRAKALHLLVPPAEYGAVHKTLAQQVRNHSLHPDPDILDLSGS